MTPLDASTAIELARQYLSADPNEDVSAKPQEDGVVVKAGDLEWGLVPYEGNKWFPNTDDTVVEARAAGSTVPRRPDGYAILPNGVVVALRDPSGLAALWRHISSTATPAALAALAARYLEVGGVSQPQNLMGDEPDPYGPPPPEDACRSIKTTRRGHAGLRLEFCTYEMEPGSLPGSSTAAVWRWTLDVDDEGEIDCTARRVAQGLGTAL